MTPKERRAQAVAEMKKLVGKGADSWTVEDRTAFDALDAEITSIDSIRRDELDEVIVTGRTGSTIEPSVALAPEQRMAEWVEKKGLVLPEQGSLDFGKFVRGIATGDWKDAEAERRSMNEGTPGAGGYTVPTPLAAQVIDLARNQTRVFQAGARTVPMTSETLSIARVASDPTAAWRGESDPIDESAMTFERVQFKAHSLAVIVKATRELLEDSNNIESELSKSFAAAFAQELDRVSLYGAGGLTDEPEGIKNDGQVSVYTMGDPAPDGASLDDFDPFLEAFGLLWDANHEPNGVIFAPRTRKTIAKFKETTTGQPLQAPAEYQAVTKYSTNQVPTDLTHGSSTDASDAFVADFTNLMVGIRTNFGIQVLNERYAENGEIGFLGWLRADVQRAHPEAFVVIEGIVPVTPPEQSA